MKLSRANQLVTSKLKFGNTEFFLAVCPVAVLLLLTIPAYAQQHISDEDRSDWVYDPLRPGSSDRPNHPVDRFALSLSEAFNTSHLQNPSVLESLKQLDETKAQIITAGARPNPQFAMQYGFGDPYTLVIAGNTQQVGANQLFEMGGKRSARLRFAKANHSLAEQRLADLRFDIRASVRKAYAELAAAEANLELVENQRALVKRLGGIAEKRFKTGKAEEVEALQAKLALESFETLRNSALARMRQASIKMNNLLGYKIDRDLDVDDNGLFSLSQKRTELVPPPDEPLPTLATLLADAFGNRPDIKAATQDIVTSSAALRLKKAEAVPDILIGSGWVFSNYKRSTGYPQQFGAFLNVNMDIPIFYRHQGEIAEAKAELERAKVKSKNVNAVVETDVRLAYSAIAAARANLTHYQKAMIPLALNMVRKAHDSYENGTADLGSTIVAQQQYQQTFSSYFDTVIAYQGAWADLETAIGKQLNF